MKHGGAGRTAVNLAYLEIEHPKFFSDYSKMLANNDEFAYIEDIIRKKFSSRFTGDTNKNASMSMYISAKLAKYV